MRRLVLVGVWVWGLAAPGGGDSPAAQTGTETPPELVDIEILDRSGTAIPGDIVLRDETGAPVGLEQFFELGRPVLVQLVYYGCPMLCSMVLNGYVEGAKPLDWTPGRDYEVVTVSFDSRDTASLAAKKKASYVAALGKPGAALGWHFLTGDEAQVSRLADSLGFRYRWVAEQKEFAHAAGMFVLTPGGRVSRTLYGIEFRARDLRLALSEASEGKLGTPWDRLLLYCFKYNQASHKYAIVAMNVMKLGGLLTLAGLGTLMAALWARERRHHPRPAV